MKKLVSFLSIAILTTAFFVSCSNDNEEIFEPQLTIETNTGELQVTQMDTLKMSLSSNFEGEVKYEWKMADEVISDGEKAQFTTCKAGEYTITITATDSKDPLKTITKEVVITVKGKFSNGTFVLNEGNMTNETGTLVFIDNKGIATDSAYYKVNQSLLGNVCQDLFIANNKIYIISQNGARNGGEGLLTIAQADDLSKIKVINNETLDWPTHVAVVENNIYIRDNKGLYFIDEETEKLSFVDGTEGVAKNRMAVVGTKVYAMKGNLLYIIENGTLKTSLEMPGSISGIIKSYDNNLWISCKSKPAQILKFNCTDNTFEGHELGDAKISAGWGAVPAIAAIKDTVYFCNAGMNIKRHIYKENKTEEVANIADYIPNAKMNYNSLGVNPETGELVFASIKGYGMDYKINNIGVFDFNLENPLKYNFENINSFPAGVFFTTNF